MTGGAWRSRGGMVVCCAVLAGAATAGSEAAPPPEPAPAVSCSFRAADQRLDVRLRDLALKLEVRLPPGIPDRIARELRHFSVRATVEIERRIDAITVTDRTRNPFYGSSTHTIELFDFGFGSERACRARPAVTDADAIRLRLGRHSEGADLLLDLRYGPLAPGPTDEGDGASEIEVDAQLGFGDAAVRMTRDADAIAVERPEGPAETGRIRVNLNAGEAVGDHDLVLGRRSGVSILGAGGDDLLSSIGAGATRTRSCRRRSREARAATRSPAAAGATSSGVARASTRSTPARVSTP